MPIQVECPECGKRFRFPDARAGETADCKSCGAEIEIPGGRSRGGKKKKKRSGSDSGPLLAIGGAVAAVAVVGLIAFMALGRGRPVVVQPAQNSAAPGQAVAANPLTSSPNTGAPAANPVMPAQTVPGGSVVAGNPIAQTTTPATTTPQQPAVPPAAANNTTPAAGSGFKQKSQTEGFKPVKDWKVQVDPLPEPVELGTADKFKIKTTDSYLQQNFVVYPSTPSPFVLVGSNMSNKDSREVWNLATGAKAGVLKGPQITGNTVGFSADGNYVAWFRHQGTEGGIEVYDIKAKKSLGAVPVDSKSFNVAQVCLPTSKRMVALSNVHRSILTWKLPSGDLEKQIQLGTNGQPDPRFAFSPGGRFLAVVGDFLTKAIDIYDLDSGEKAGAIEFANRGPDLFGLAFSGDGTELAAAYGNPFSQDAERIVIWDAATGAIREDFHLPNPEQRTRDLINVKTSLQWFPNRKRLLLNGMYVVDRDSKDVVFAFPKQSFDFHTSVTRKVLSDTSIANWDGSPKSATIAPLEVKSEDIALAREIAAAGGLPIDVKLPRLTPFQRDKAIDRTAGSANWLVVADPASGQGSLEGKLALKPDSKHVRELKFSSPQAGIACLRQSDDDDENMKGLMRSLMPQMNHVMRNNRNRLRSRNLPPLCQSNWLDLYDVGKGTATGRIEPGFPCELLAVSPDGSRVIVAPMNGEGRLDVFAADGSHVAACRPFLDDGEKLQHELASAVFVDDSTIAATSLNDRLVVFRIPSCEPVYRVDEAGTLAVSPGRRYIATSDTNRVELRDARTGESQGSITLDGTVNNLSFSATGDRLAALTTGRGGSVIAVINLVDGTQSAVPVPQASSPLLWCGANEILVGGQFPTAENSTLPRGSGVEKSLMLIDLNRQAVIWSYIYGNQDDFTFGHETFDGRLWLAGAKTKGKGSQVTAVSLPEPAATKLLTEQKINAQTIVRPGMSIGLKFEVADAPGIEGYARKARDLVDAAIKHNELTVKNGSPIQLVIQIAPGNASGTLELQSFGTGNQQKITVQRKSVTVRLAYETGGKAVWGAKYDVGNEFFGLTRLPPGKDAQSVLDENMWQRAAEILQTSPPPAHVFSPESARGLGTSRLSGEGTQPGGK